jgi:hypothetical protein
VDRRRFESVDRFQHHLLRRPDGGREQQRRETAQNASRQIHANNSSQRNKGSQAVFSTTLSFDRDMPNALM